MSRIESINPNTATGKAKALLDAVQAKLGLVPNMTRAMASGPAALEGYLNFAGALAGGSLDARLREKIALAVAEANGCDYCLSAHTAIGGVVGLKADEIEAARRASGDTRTAAALRFARDVVAARGGISDASLAAVRSAGYADGEIAEIVANVALNVYTNYFNRVAQTEIDFPRAPHLVAQAA